MPSSAIRKDKAASFQRALAPGSDNGPIRVVACVNMSPASVAVIPHASALAGALDGELALIHVVEPSNSTAPSDPIEWEIRRREADLFVSELARRFETASNIVATEVLQGRSADKICECTASRFGDITALCRNDSGSQDRLGETARSVMEASSGSFLLVPATQSDEPYAHYRRIMVPLDGSTRAESALPIAVRLVADQGAELILVHAVQKYDFIHGGPPDVQDIELQGQLTRHVRCAAREYLSRIEESLIGSDIAVKTLLLDEGDVSRRLADAVVDHSIDLLVMSSHGQSGYSDVPVGHVSNYILSHVRIPVLMVRRPRQAGTRHIYSGVRSSGIRRPHEDLE